MFVAERRFILKTCGTTTPLEGLKHLLELVEKYAGFNEVDVSTILKFENFYFLFNLIFLLHKSENCKN